MAIEPKDISADEYNTRLTDWGGDVLGKIRSSIRNLTSKGKGDLVKSLRMKTHKDFGEVDSIGYSFKHYGVFVHKGVGRGYVMIGGNVMHVKGYMTKKSIIDFAKRRGTVISSKFDSSLKRKPEPWLNPVIDDNIERLANMVTEMRADQAVNATRIYIQ
jgi:hypothetical protein